MSKVLVNETSLTAIGNAIRDKNGKSDKYKPSEMAAAIGAIETGGGGDIEVEPIVLTGDCSYACSGALADAYITLFGDTITTSGITNASYMFSNCRNPVEIPFDINVASSCISFNYLFNNCNNLTSLPKIKGTIKEPTSKYYLCNFSNIFNNCYNLREIPNDYFSFLPENYVEIKKKYLGDGTATLCNGMYSLRRMPSKDILKLIINYGSTNYFYSMYYSMFYSCYTLDEIIDLPVETINYTSNCFASFVINCYRLKNLIFETNEDGSPIVVKWKNQTIDLQTVGYGVNLWNGELAFKYNSGITRDKFVKDEATYQALKDDSDWFTQNIEYSRYNHDSAVATINSLPDASAYLATAGGTNTIKFKGASGSATDGGAINTLTEEEIAVAAAKGWTITLV